MNFQPSSVFTFFMVLMIARNLDGKFLLIDVKNGSEVEFASGRSEGIHIFCFFKNIMSYKVHQKTSCWSNSNVLLIIEKCVNGCRICKNKVASSCLPNCFDQKSYFECQSKCIEQFKPGPSECLRDESCRKNCNSMCEKLWKGIFHYFLNSIYHSM